MTKRTSRRWGETVLRGVVLLVLLTPATGFSQGEWEQWFREPPPRYRPEVYWDWMGGLISREGITKDLEALEHAGVGGVLIMQMPDQLAGVVQWRFRDYPGKVKCLSDEWFAMMNHAAKECDRLGLRMSFLMCPGWSHCGGPWIQPEKGLKILVTRLIGDEVEPEDCELVPWNPPERKGGYAMDVPGRGLRDLPDWLLSGAARPSSHRYTFTTWRCYPKGAPVLPSDLLGPVTILGEGESAEHK